MNKPVVHYTPTNGEQIMKGSCGLIFGVQDHPRLGYQGYVITTKIEHVFDNGKFETLNTIYEPVHTDSAR